MGQMVLPEPQIPDHLFAAQGRMFEISLPSRSSSRYSSSFCTSSNL